MTPERKMELMTRMNAIVAREIKTLVELEATKIISAAEASEWMADMSEITACIGVTYAALNLGVGRKGS